MAARFEKTRPTTRPGFCLVTFSKPRFRQQTYSKMKESIAFNKMGIVIDEVELPPQTLGQTGQAGRQAQSMALCLVRAPDATMAAAMAAPSWIRWLGWGPVGTCASLAGAESTGLRPRSPVRSLFVLACAHVSVLCGTSSAADADRRPWRVGRGAHRPCVCRVWCPSVPVLSPQNCDLAVLCAVCAYLCAVHMCLCFVCGICSVADAVPRPRGR